MPLSSHSQAQLPEPSAWWHPGQKIHADRYKQREPGHQIQVDVKFLKLEVKDGKEIKRYQYTASDDAMRIRVHKIYDRHNLAKAWIEAADATMMFLPPYSPDIDPIEKAFSKLNAHLCKAAELTVFGLWDRIGKLVDLVEPHKCRNYFKSCGYDPI